MLTNILCSHPAIQQQNLRPADITIQDGDQPAETADNDRVSPPFDDIRRFCEGSLPFDRPVDARPQAVAAHHIQYWPDMLAGPSREALVHIYKAVKATGLPNAMKARIPVPSNLNIPAWEHYLGNIGDRERVLDFVKYGFPTGYAGPVSDTKDTPNHPSATDFPAHVEEFIAKEIELQGLVGPTASPIFAPWAHCSPLMTREKGESGKRRIITDMTFPPESSVNAYIVKNGMYGFEHSHSLPTVNALATDVRDMGWGAFLATIDVSRAYRNFVSDPLDWPLLCFKWRDSHYCDLSMPFGAWASSSHMQSVANCITEILRRQGIHCYMYLDDLVLLAPVRYRAEEQYNRMQALLAELGLPEVVDKAQPPSHRVKWLGVYIDTDSMTLSILQKKLEEVMTQVSEVYEKAHISKRTLQSLLGHLLFIAKCVRPARIFVSRLLNALRVAKGGYIKVDDDMHKDLSWFKEFGLDWNGVAVIPPSAPDRVILVDTCMSGVGATDGKFAYGQQIAHTDQNPFNITWLEAMNVVLTVHTFVTHRDRGAHIRVRCDNEAAVQVFKSGKARNHILQECARAVWMVKAVMDIHLSFDHIPGKDNDVADALSRAHLSTDMLRTAKGWAQYYSLTMVSPCLFFMSTHVLVSSSRPSAASPDGQGSGKAGYSARSSDPGQQRIGGDDVHRLHGTDGRRSQGTKPHRIIFHTQNNKISG